MGVGRGYEEQSLLSLHFFLSVYGSGTLQLFQDECGIVAIQLI